MPSVLCALRTYIASNLVIIYETLQHSWTEFSREGLPLQLVIHCSTVRLISATFSRDEPWKMTGWENVDLMPGTTLNFISDIPGAYWLQGGHYHWGGAKVA